MKIAVTADVHLGIREDHPERYTALENIFEQIEAENIKSLLIAGDLFDKDFRNYSEFEKLCKKHPGIELHIIPGNHDPNISGKSIVGENIHIYTDPATMEIDSTIFLSSHMKKKQKWAKRSPKWRVKSGRDNGSSSLMVTTTEVQGNLTPLNPGPICRYQRKT